ncbi:MAG: type II toxin-antitoxin system Phd/YefM family antitoxin [Fibrobacteres bacterium]|nr:type II toxin-antitoxin system Phd/YefM family antitoxin [Fibrobacterota bacterium]
MKTLSVSDIKTNFSEVIQNIKTGEQYTVEFGRRHEKIAVILPYSHYKKKNKLKFGLMADRKIVMSDDFSISNDEFLGLK